LGHLFDPANFTRVIGIFIQAIGVFLFDPTNFYPSNWDIYLNLPSFTQVIGTFLSDLTIFYPSNWDIY
jgi:uncharacterized membrane protein